MQVIDYQLHKIVLEMQKLCRGTLGGQKIGKNLQMKLPPKKRKSKHLKIWQIVSLHIHIR